MLPGVTDGSRAKPHPANERRCWPERLLRMPDFQERLRNRKLASANVQKQRSIGFGSGTGTSSPLDKYSLPMGNPANWTLARKLSGGRIDTKRRSSVPAV